MLYANPGYATKTMSGHIGSEYLTKWLKENALYVDQIQADGDELARCCEILGRPVTRRVYTFFGDNAKEIALNW